MITNGFLDEVKALTIRIRNGKRMPFQARGIGSWGENLEGKSSLEEAISKTKFQTHRPGPPVNTHGLNQKTRE
ncbi:MAG: hypothetical protein Ct9H300mP27_11140 [Chloroflexota bacterium]|nr:MAG: hypothetical protein Ct9H300mP27_11140 [Chloroflexota bacterium]